MAVSMRNTLFSGLALLGLAFSPSGLAKKNNIDGITKLYLAEAEFLDKTQQPALASTRLQEALELGLMPSNEEQDQIKARSARSQLNWGMHYLPSAIYQQLVDRQRPYKLNDQTWLDLATLQYRRGYWGLTGAVEYSLSRIKKRPRRAIRGARTMLRSQLYLKQNRFAQAERTLSRYRGSFDEQPYAEFNQAVALLKQGNAEQGAALLDKVGNMRSNDDTLLALRDLANYTLGNWFLNNNQAGTAIPILKRVRAEGPYSNKALLALGWAYLSDTGKLQRVDEIYSPRCLKNAVAQTGALVNNRNRDCRPGRTLRIENLGPKEQNRLQRAMTAWQVVQERSPLFPGVQETLMALPYALDQMGYTYVAEQQYKKAIQSLQYEADRINDALDVIHAGQLLKTTITDDSPGHDQRWNLSGINHSRQLDMRLLYQLYSEHEFYEALINYRQLRHLQSQLKGELKKLKQLAANRPKQPRRLSSSASLKTESAQAAQASDNLQATTDTKQVRQQFLSSLGSRQLSSRLTKGSNQKPTKSKVSVWKTHQKTAQSSLGERAKTLLPKVEVLSKQVANLAAQHAGYIALQSENELKLKLDRVNTYMAQARLSLGRIKDRQADLGESGETAPAPRKIEDIDFNPLFKVESED